ncbi:hypothetical protein AYJ08_13965 [Brevibacillus sp. SKDU10]|uniref:hypothetical protein n=1 Tax=Brevibacillus sp. SKDU10 TaxID=1247872 RepID=UPI0007C924BF|nr:hypothetical protein [Brevibacillus sp. SKDU10]OAJ73534.1 hypothetical protein AYJ08_13965 [Brevibacillus sp. SKDU10]
MIYIEHENSVVTFVHYMPFDEVNGLGKSSEELQTTGLLVDSIPQPEANGKIPKLFINPKTQELWYEYTDRPLSPEEEIVRLKAQLKITQDALDALLLK